MVPPQFVGLSQALVEVVKVTQQSMREISAQLQGSPAPFSPVSHLAGSL